MNTGPITKGARGTGNSSFLVPAPQTMATSPCNTKLKPIVTMMTETSGCPTIGRKMPRSKTNPRVIMPYTV